MAEQKTVGPEYIWAFFGLKQGDYTSLGRVCAKHNLPRFREGKRLRFPQPEIDRRLEAIKINGMREMGVRP